MTNVRDAFALCAFAAAVCLGAPERPARWEIPNDTPWELIKGRGDVRRVGERWVWDANPVNRGGTVGIRLPVDLAGFDEIRFEYRPTHGPVMLMVTTDGFPNAALSRNWYDKNPLKEKEWNQVAFDLELDDDGRPTRRADGQDLWITFRYVPATANDDPTQRTVEFRNLRLVRHPVRWQIDYFRTRHIWRGDRYEVAYPVSLRNRMSRPVTVHLRLRRESPRRGEPLFQLPSDSALTWTLQPYPFQQDNQGAADRWGGGWAELSGDAIPAWISFSAPAEAVRAQTSLWTELVWPHLEVDGFVEPILPLHSSRIDPWFLTVPPKQALHPALEATPATLERARERNASNPQFSGVLDGFIAHAERVLKLPRIVRGPQPKDLDRTPENWRAIIRPQWRQHWFVPTQNLGHGRTILGMTYIEANINSGRRALDLARAWALTGREEFRQAALEVFLAYADQYPLWEPKRISSTAFRSRAAENTLMVGFRYPNYFTAYDYLRASLSAAERRTIEDRFLLPVARVADNHVNDYNNQLTVHNLVPFSWAIADENWSLAMRYVDGPRGLYAMRHYGFDADGMGMEHDLGYHWNSLDPMIRVAVALDHYGHDSRAIRLEF